MTASRDPGDVFCELWDAYRPGWSINDLEEWSEPDAFAETVASFAEEIINHQGVPAVRAEAVDGPFTAFELAQAINDALETTAPTRTGRSGSLLPGVAARWARTGLLNDATGGALLIRFVLPGRPGPVDSVDDWFTNVVRVDPARWSRVDHRVVVSGRHELSPVADTGGPTVRVGCMPVADTLDDFVIDGSANDYHLAPGARLRDPTGMAEALAALDAAEIDVAVLPEATIDQASGDAWAEVLSSCPPGPRQRLKWVLIGSGPFDLGDSKPRNRAVILDRRTGREIAAQDKRFRFQMTADHVTDWGLDPYLAAASLAERIAVGDRVTIIESLTGRHGVLICEDLSRPTGVGDLEALGSSHLYVPIFAKEILRYRWQEQGVDGLLSHAGAFGVVSNNLAVLNARAANGVDVSEGHTSLAHLPGDIHPDRYHGDVHVGLSGHRFDVVVFDLTLPA